MDYKLAFFFVASEQGYSTHCTFISCTRHQKLLSHGKGVGLLSRFSALLKAWNSKDIWRLSHLQARPSLDCSLSSALSLSRSLSLTHTHPAHFKALLPHHKKIIIGFLIIQSTLVNHVLSAHAHSRGLGQPLARLGANVCIQEG